MTSYEVRRQKEDFVRSVNKYLEKHAEILLKIEEIEKIIDGSQDTSLIPFMNEVNALIKSKMSLLDSSVEGYRNDTIRKVDAEIARLEEEERLEREKLAKDREDAIK